ncbi:MAG: hypothetical protein R2867_46835 [Caldilineaceae bacterium]
MSPTTQTVANPASIQDRSTDPVLEIQNLHTYFFLEKGIVKAVNGVEFNAGTTGDAGRGR